MIVARSQAAIPSKTVFVADCMLALVTKIVFVFVFALLMTDLLKTMMMRLLEMRVRMKTKGMSQP